MSENQSRFEILDRIGENIAYVEEWLSSGQSEEMVEGYLRPRLLSALKDLHSLTGRYYFAWGASDDPDLD